EILAQEYLPAAQGEEKGPGFGQLTQDVLDLGRRHLAVVFVIQIAVDAALVAAEGQVDVRAERHAQFESLLIHFLHQTHGPSCYPRCKIRERPERPGRALGAKPGVSEREPPE